MNKISKYCAFSILPVRIISDRNVNACQHLLCYSRNAVIKSLTLEPRTEARGETFEKKGKTGQREVREVLRRLLWNLLHFLVISCNPVLMTHNRLCGLNHKNLYFPVLASFFFVFRWTA